MTGLDNSQPLTDEKTLAEGKAHPRPHEAAPTSAQPDPDPAAEAHAEE